MNKRTTLCLIGFVLVILFAATVSFAEELKLETYYPSPSGYYNALKAKQFAVGEDDNGDLLPITEGIVFRVGGEKPFVVLDNGNVGIGTVDPQATLEINGNIKRTGSDCFGSGTNANTHINLGFESIAGAEEQFGQAYLYCTVSGGFQNEAAGSHSTVSGGKNNRAAKQYTTVSGGADNQAIGDNSTICGGTDNIAEGNNSVVCGGQQNFARGTSSLAAGYYAGAVHDHSFVWSDNALSNAQHQKSKDERTFNVYAANGSYFEGKVNVKDVLNLNPRNAPPSSGAEGDICYVAGSGLYVRTDNGGSPTWRRVQFE